MTDPSATLVPRWLQWCAWCAVALALPLAAFGAEVTTKNVGMADRVALRSPLYLLQPESPGGAIRLFHLIETGQYGLLIEHSHRLFGWAVGLAAIVLCVGLLLGAGDWRRWLGLVVLAAVVGQGLLGIFRVSEISKPLAALHGCAAQLVFATLAAVAVTLSDSWARPGAASGLRWYSVALLALLYVQIVFGAIMRHLLDPVAQRLHVLLAFAAVVGVLWLARQVRKEDSSRGARLAAHLLAAFIVLQPILGVEAWVRRFGSGELPDAVQSSFWGDLTRSGHHVLGTLIFATTAALTTLLFRPRERATSHAMLHARAMEGISR